MKIGLFTDSYLPLRDGVATSVATLADELKRMDNQAYVFAPRHPQYKDQENVIRLPALRLFKKPEFWMGLEVPHPSLIKAFIIDFDIIHGHSGGPISFLGWQIARIKKIPYVLTYHTLFKHYVHYFPYPKLLKPWMFDKASAYFGNSCDALIAPTQKVKRELLNYGVKKKINVIPSGIDIDKFTDNKQGFLHNKLEISERYKIILAVGRLEKEKSVEFLIKSFARAARVQPDIVLVLVGEGREKKISYLKKLTKNMNIDNRVHFAGIIPYSNMQKVYADSDIFVFASHTETQGLVVMEALASGVPVIAVHDIVFEGVIRSGFNGYMVDRNVERFANKIVHLARNADLRWKLGKNASFSAQRFSVRNTAKDTIALYESLIKNKHLANKPAMKDQLLPDIYA